MKNQKGKSTLSRRSKDENSKMNIVDMKKHVHSAKLLPREAAKVREHCPSLSNNISVYILEDHFPLLLPIVGAKKKKTNES